MSSRAPSHVGPSEVAARPLRVAFVVDLFPLVSETFVIDQVAGLLDRGVDVKIYSFGRSDGTNVSQKYYAYDMSSRVTYLDYPLPKLRRLLGAWPRAWRLLRRHRRVLLRAVDFPHQGRWALSLKLLYWAEPIAGESFDVIHCHFGTVARGFVRAARTAGLTAPLVTSLYGVDISRVPVTEPADYYDELKDACSLFFVMSEDMRRRAVEHGFPADKVRVHPVGVDVGQLPFRLRERSSDDELRLVAVGRFVEKKGFDDVLRAVALVKERARQPVSCTIVGGGPLEEELLALTDSLGLRDTVRFTGYLPVERVLEVLDEAHVLLAPSKTATDGDME